MRLVFEGMEDGVRDELENLRANLTHLRKVRKLTNYELGILAGVKERQVSVWLNAPITVIPVPGQDSFNPRMVNLVRVASALEMPVGDFFLPAPEFAKRYSEEADAPKALRVASNPRSSSPSKAGRKGGSRRAAAGRSKNGAMREYVDSPCDLGKREAA